MVTSGDVKKGKSYPESYTVTVSKLKEKPEDCLVIEDSDNGVISAKSAGCQVCAITATFSPERLKSAGADVVVSSFKELSEILF